MESVSAFPCSQWALETSVCAPNTGVKPYGDFGPVKSPGQGDVNINTSVFVCSDLSWSVRGNHCAEVSGLVPCIIAATQAQPGQLSPAPTSQVLFQKS